MILYVSHRRWKKYLEIVRGSASNDYFFVGLCDATLTTGVGYNDTGT